MAQAREAQYKYRGRSKGLESRLKGKAVDSKRQREELLSGRRRAALLEINEEIMAEEEIQGLLEKIYTCNSIIIIHKF